MFSPHTITFNRHGLLITRHDGADYHAGAPWHVRWNLLRYGITFNAGTSDHFTINNDGWLARQWSNFLFFLRWRPICVVAGHDHRPGYGVCLRCMKKKGGTK